MSIQLLLSNPALFLTSNAKTQGSSLEVAGDGSISCACTVLWVNHGKALDALQVMWEKVVG